MDLPTEAPGDRDGVRDLHLRALGLTAAWVLPGDPRLALSLDTSHAQVNDNSSA